MHCSFDDQSYLLGKVISFGASRKNHVPFSTVSPFRPRPIAILPFPSSSLLLHSHSMVGSVVRSQTRLGSRITKQAVGCDFFQTCRIILFDVRRPDESTKQPRLVFLQLQGFQALWQAQWLPFCIRESWNPAQSNSFPSSASASSIFSLFFTFFNLSIQPGAGRILSPTS